MSSRQIKLDVPTVMINGQKPKKRRRRAPDAATRTMQPPQREAQPTAMHPMPEELCEDWDQEQVQEEQVQEDGVTKAPKGKQLACSRQLAVRPTSHLYNTDLQAGVFLYPVDQSGTARTLLNSTCWTLSCLGACCTWTAVSLYCQTASSRAATTVASWWGLLGTCRTVCRVMQSFDTQL